VFVVGYLGDWRPGAAVLFERESLQGHPPPSRKARKEITGTLGSRSSAGGGLGTDFELDGGIVAGTLRQRTCDHTSGLKSESDFLVAHMPVAFGGNNTSGPIDVATAINAHGGPHGRLDFETETFIAHALRAEGFDASEDGTVRGTPLVAVPMMASVCVGSNGAGIGQDGDPAFALDTSGAQAIAFSCKDHGADASTDLAPTMRAMNFSESHANAGGQLAVAFRVTGNDGGYELGDQAACLNTGTDPTSQVRVESVSLRGREGGATAELGGDVCPSLRTGGGGGDKPHALTGMAVRRLTPRECERLQGFPDDFTKIPWRGKYADQCPDGPRYRSLGNSMAVPVMRWLAERIDMVESILKRDAA
jgi:DNA (cytosine-5)-methyltransferase 1